MGNDAMKKVLHVEDDPDFRSYVKLVLKDVVDVDQADTLAQARDLIGQNDYSLVLLDLTLPDGSGMSIVGELKSSAPEMPIVIFSSHNVTPAIDNVSKVFQKGYFSERSLVDAIKVLTA
jgi:DNA-binding response OmpR family regulator